MSTSASITHTSVSTSSLPESPKKGRARSVAGAAGAGSFMSWVLPRGIGNYGSSEPAQPRYDAPHKRIRQTAGEVGDRGAFADFPQRRVGHDHLGKRPDVEALGDRQRPRHDQLARVGTYDRGTKNPPALGGNDLDVPARFPLPLGTVVLVIGPAQHADAPAGLRLRQPDVGKLGVGVGDPWDDGLVGARAQAEQHVPDDDPGVVIRRVGELQPARHVADRVDAAVAGAQPFVDEDAARPGLDAGSSKVEAVEVRAPAGRDKQMARLDRLLLVRRRHDDAQLRAAFDAQNAGAGTDADALARELIEQDRGAFRIVVGERGRGFDDRDARAETAERLRHFETDRAGADDDELFGAYGEVEHGLVGQIRDLVEPGDRRDRAARAGRDPEGPRLDLDSLADPARRFVLE